MQRALLVAVLLLPLILHSRGAEPIAVSVTTALPGDRAIWPLPSPAAPVVVSGEFASFDELLRVRSGDYFEITSRAVYRVSGEAAEFPEREISFIVRERWATPESGIMEKSLPRFFTPGTTARFWMARRARQRIWDIQTYEISDPTHNAHYGPKA